MDNCTVTLAKPTWSLMHEYACVRTQKIIIRVQVRTRGICPKTTIWWGCDFQPFLESKCRKSLVLGHMPAKWRAIPALGLQTDVRTQLCCVVCAMRNALRNSNARPIALQLPVY